MMNMNPLAVVTPSPIYHGCSTQNKLWEENFTGEEKLFSAVNMKKIGHCNVQKHKDVKGNDKYITLDISFKFENLDKMKIISSELEGKLEVSGKG